VNTFSVEFFSCTFSFSPLLDLRIFIDRRILLFWCSSHIWSDLWSSAEDPFPFFSGCYAFFSLRRAQSQEVTNSPFFLPSETVRAFFFPFLVGISPTESFLCAKVPLHTTLHSAFYSLFKLCEVRQSFTHFAILFSSLPRGNLVFFLPCNVS